MRVFKTSDPAPSSETEQLWVYNALDCCVTLEVFHAISPQLDEITSKTYEYSKALQGPVLEMECRGVLVDLDERSKVSKILEEKLEFLESSLREILRDGVGEEVNWNSPAQLMELFYKTLGLPAVRFQGRPTVNRNALEKLKGYFYAEPIVRHILAIRDLKKKLGVLKTGIDSDGRIRTSYNIAGTDTGRFSSYTSSFGSGTNLQNITGELRQIFVANRGYKFAHIDLEQVQSRVVGAIIWNFSHDGTYLDACESSDLHTVVCKLCWEHLGWTGEYRTDRALADQPFYRVDSYRQASKKLGHATNFFGKPQEISRQVAIPMQLVADFQVKYLKAFPGIKNRFDFTRKKLLSDGFITTMTGRRRWFFGRRWEDEVLKQALAYEPQDVESYILGNGLLALFRHGKFSTAMLHNHDALVIQYKEEHEHEALEEALRLMTIEIPLMYGRSLTVPLDTKTGWNWAYASENNPDGLDKVGKVRSRTNAPVTSFMDRRLF